MRRRVTGNAVHSSAVLPGIHLAVEKVLELTDVVIGANETCFIRKIAGDYFNAAQIY
jgi:hypothetical protein